METLRGRIENTAATIIGQHVSDKSKAQQLMAGVLRVTEAVEAGSRWIPRVPTVEQGLAMAAGFAQALQPGIALASDQPTVPDVSGIYESGQARCSAILSPNAIQETIIFSAVFPSSEPVWNLQQSGNYPNEHLHTTVDGNSTVIFTGLKADNQDFKLSCGEGYEDVDVTDLNNVFGLAVGLAGDDNWFSERAVEISADKDSNGNTLELVATTRDTYIIFQDGNDPNEHLVGQPHPETGEFSATLKRDSNHFKVDEVTRTIDNNNRWGPMLGDVGRDGWYTEREATILPDQDNNPNTLELQVSTTDPYDVLDFNIVGPRPDRFPQKPNSETGKVVFGIRSDAVVVSIEDVIRSSSENPDWKPSSNPDRPNVYRRVYNVFLPKVQGK